MSTRKKDRPGVERRMFWSAPISDAEHERLREMIMRRHRALFSGLAAYDRGEYRIKRGR